MEVSVWTLIGEGITFLVFILVTWKFVWPPLTQAMEERRQKIAEGLAAGEQAEKDLEVAREKAEQLLAEARQQANQIREQAASQASQIKEQARADAQAERERQVEAAQAEIEQEANRARKELASKVGALAVSGAERILSREIDAAAHRELLDQLAAEL
ncbi:MAG: F0F1 ATP synthase subunit B [Xanthomonadales bacterium]|nr:F0F1 ATP synthase subunit B [Xanthomonadales bacterium]